MKADFRIADPDSVEMSLTITMPLSDWSNLQRQLETTKYPSWKMATEIGKMIQHARLHFHAGQAEEQEG